ncbi:MAG: DNA polymerase IV [Sphingobacteriales bacterium]|nr:MAG: DNA polymerase IV [Sphingobacteriales bacterium]
MQADNDTNSLSPQSVVMYVDMNSFFASCEQQDFPELRGKPIGVCTYDGPHAAVIAPSIEAKRFGVKTGMRMSDCRMLCPQIIPVTTRPHVYRQYHITIMEVLARYCPEVKAKSIDEAVMNLTAYKLVYHDFHELARKIKADLREKCGEVVTCSIGIAPNSFLAKLATEIQKPNGLIEITPENVDSYLGKMKLTDLPGIARSNERRLQMIGIKNPVDMRHASQSLLRKAFGGVVGHYWHSRLNFKEVDLYNPKQAYRAMSAARTISRQQRESYQALDSMLISLCTRLEQRLVKQRVFCREMSFYIGYLNQTSWNVNIRFPQPVQDAMEMRSYINERMQEFEQSRKVECLLSSQTRYINVVVQNFVTDQYMQYSLFDNRIQKDKLRKVMYEIKDKYGKNTVRKATETIQPKVMKDAIGFGSVKDLYSDHFNKYLLEEN